RLDARGETAGEVIVSGNDFYSTPRLSPDGQRLAWLTWNHPNMPWDGTELWVAELSDTGSLGERERIAGGDSESIFQPEWSPDNRLHFVSDRTGWWNLYRVEGDEARQLVEMEAEFGRPQWGFRMSTYAFAGASRIVCAYNLKGIWRVALLDAETLDLGPVELPYTDISYLRAARGEAVFYAGSSVAAASLVRLDLETREVEVLRRANNLQIDPGYISTARAVEFPTTGGMTAHAFYYAPNNRDFRAPEGERPPLLVISHGGPTSAAVATLEPMIQYWTSRGIAVLDVNYGGSTGYGRAYRERLNGQWGIVDVDDCINGALYMVEQGEADPDRLIIRGGSAGGYTTLAALTFRDVFKAGASYYGICDLEALEVDGHKFEARYNHNLIGPYPAERELYRARSPIHFTNRLSCPIILFQGLEDKVVPPNQAEMMVEAMRSKGLPVAYVPFAGEQHGFRRAENIKRALDTELYFYSRVFGFDADVQPDPGDIARFENFG
ncbi:MAG TPA: prolyl oligopeptidase family serine peptidase, partial [Blastocatellia bacterium]|nr:prolyl oligopeptidase family serine peptidase [Blastocatellia bacterium]